MVRYNMVLCHIKWLLDVSNVPSLGYFTLGLNLVPSFKFFFWWYLNFAHCIDRKLM